MVTVKISGLHKTHKLPTRLTGIYRPRDLRLPRLGESVELINAETGKSIRLLAKVANVDEYKRTYDVLIRR